MIRPFCPDRHIPRSICEARHIIGQVSATACAHRNHFVTVSRSKSRADHELEERTGICITAASSPLVGSRTQPPDEVTTTYPTHSARRYTETKSSEISTDMFTRNSSSTSSDSDSHEFVESDVISTPTYALLRTDSRCRISGSPQRCSPTPHPSLRSQGPRRRSGSCSRRGCRRGPGSCQRTVPLLPPTTRKLHSPTSPPRSVPPQNRRPLSSLRPPPRQPPPRPTLRRSSTSQRRPTSPSSATCLPRASVSVTSAQHAKPLPVARCSSCRQWARSRPTSAPAGAPCTPASTSPPRSGRPSSPSPTARSSIQVRLPGSACGYAYSTQTERSPSTATSTRPPSRSVSRSWPATRSPLSATAASSTGPHLHFEVHLAGENKIDPLPWLASRGISLGVEQD